MKIPLEPEIFGLHLNVHLICEILGFFLGYRYYALLRKQKGDFIPDINRLYIIMGAALGAFFGSRIAGLLEYPFLPKGPVNWLLIFNSKSIMGGLFGGLLGVEMIKKIIGEKQASGDLFTLPLLLGIFIGRMGCFLTGTKEFTYGVETNLFTGMNLGDGLHRHPLALYEMIYLLLLWMIFRKMAPFVQHENGKLFKLFMLCYFGFRFCIEFLKPNMFYLAGLSTIQWLCVLCYLYYLPFILKQLKNAG